MLYVFQPEINKTRTDFSYSPSPTLCGEDATGLARLDRPTEVVASDDDEGIALNVDDSPIDGPIDGPDDGAGGFAAENPLKPENNPEGYKEKQRR